MSDVRGYIPARENLPPLGHSGAGTGSERLCSRHMSGNMVTSQGEVTCDQPATHHIIWEDTGTGVESGYTCDQHVAEVRRRWKPWAIHSLGACCGMPGALFFVEANECRYEDGLPTVEPVRAVAKDTPTHA